MQTRRLTCPNEAAALLRQGCLVAFPTETVYGLGVDATNAEAVARLFVAKGRPSDNPLIVHLACAEDWPLAAREMTPSAQRLLDAFAPGPITLVLPKQAAISELVTGGLDTVGIRIPQAPAALQMLTHARLPIAAPSANRSGKPSSTTWQAVLEDLDGRIDAVLVGEASQLGVESTVVDCCSEPPVVLRPGGIDLERIQSICPNAVSLRDVQDPRRSDPHMRQGLDPERMSPGMRYAHYQPRARVWLFESSQELPGLLALAGPSCIVVTCRNEACDWINGMSLPAELEHQHFASYVEYARDFYEILRQADRRAVDVILLQVAEDRHLGAALRDRQLRAAQQPVSTRSPRFDEQSDKA